MDHEVMDFPRMIVKLERKKYGTRKLGDRPRNQDYGRTPQKIRDCTTANERNPK